MYGFPYFYENKIMNATVSVHDSISHFSAVSPKLFSIIYFFSFAFVRRINEPTTSASAASGWWIYQPFEILALSRVFHSNFVMSGSLPGMSAADTLSETDTYMYCTSLYQICMNGYSKEHFICPANATPVMRRWDSPWQRFWIGKNGFYLCQGAEDSSIP